MRHRPRGTASRRRGSSSRSLRGKSAHDSQNQRIPEDVVLGPVLQARGGVWSGEQRSGTPGSRGRGVAVVGTAEKEPRVLVASRAGQEPAGWGRPLLRKGRQKRLGWSPALGCSPHGGCVAPCAEPDFGMFYLLRWTGPGDQLHPGYEGQAGPGDLSRALPGAPCGCCRPRPPPRAGALAAGEPGMGSGSACQRASSSPWKCEGSGQSTDV